MLYLGRVRDRLLPVKAFPGSCKRLRLRHLAVNAEDQGSDAFPCWRSPIGKWSDRSANI
ncbi:hypothetical protein MES4922_10116 [Mesorhizobium ventifaucium]|uniref:Uncharacterized protein n=1 Tax=Mesorhizobium ventifaucium TaxID=666020 RepID=A0ABM9DCF2_9HYPH|nr:hypothetical protein MES4922_10116 [Mesorhizobium ventifaucium]